MKKYLLVENEFKPDSNYPIKIRPQYARILYSLHKGQKLNPQEYISQHQSEFTRKDSHKATAAAIYHALTVGKKIGILRDVSPQESGLTISYEDFCKKDTVKYFMEQHRGSRFKNLDPKNGTGTADRYARNLWYFDNWLCDREFEFACYVPAGPDTFQRQKTKLKLKGVEHLLELYQESFHAEKDFVKIVKLYLMDPVNSEKRANTIKIMYNSIKSYFDKNDSPLVFKYDYNARHRTNNSEDDQPSLSLDEVIELLTVGKPSLVQKAVFLCKLHRGLDTSTLIDRFNFEAWEQLVDYFGTADYTAWDLSKCPVPIKLTRIKTDFPHIGFLGRDAVVAIQKYLVYRKKQTGGEMTRNEPLFLNAHKHPIEKDWINFSLKKLCKNSSLDKTLPGYKQKRYKINPHEFRDLLKSTLLACGVRADVADHVIGHKPKDSYEKQAILYPESLRTEYAKASAKLNVFSNMSHYMKGFENVDELKAEIKEVKEENEKFKLELLRQLEIKLSRK